MLAMPASSWGACPRGLCRPRLRGPASAPPAPPGTCMTYLRLGSCSRGYYDGYSNAKKSRARKALCLSESKCKFAAFKPDITCSRYDEKASCARAVAAPITVYAKTLCEPPPAFASSADLARPLKTPFKDYCGDHGYATCTLAAVTMETTVYFESRLLPARIRDKSSSKCLDLGHNNLAWHDCHNGDNQKFYLRPRGAK